MCPAITQNNNNHRHMSEHRPTRYIWHQYSLSTQHKACIRQLYPAMTNYQHVRQWKDNGSTCDGMSYSHCRQCVYQRDSQIDQYIVRQNVLMRNNEPSCLFIKYGRTLSYSFPRVYILLCPCTIFLITKNLWRLLPLQYLSIVIAWTCTIRVHCE